MGGKGQTLFLVLTSTFDTRSFISLLILSEGGILSIVVSPLSLLKVVYPKALCPGFSALLHRIPQALILFTDTLGYYILPKIWKAGFRVFLLGLESTSDKSLKLLNKGGFQ